MTSTVLRIPLLFAFFGSTLAGFQQESFQDTTRRALSALESRDSGSVRREIEFRYSDEPVTYAEGPEQWHVQRTEKYLDQIEGDRKLDPPSGMRSSVPRGDLGSGTVEFLAVGSVRDWNTLNTSPAGDPKIEPCGLACGMMERPFRWDDVKELCEAARKRGIKIDLCLSHPNRHDADSRPYAHHPPQVASSPKPLADLDVARKQFCPCTETAPDPTPEETKLTAARHFTQLVELLCKHGKVEMLWFDQWLEPSVSPQLCETKLLIRRTQPEVMVRARGSGNCVDYTPEGLVHGDKESEDMPCFVIHSFGRRSSYDPDRNNCGGGFHRMGSSRLRRQREQLYGGHRPRRGRGFSPGGGRTAKIVGRVPKVNDEGICANRLLEGLLWRGREEVHFKGAKDRRTICAFVLRWPSDSPTLATVQTRRGGRVRIRDFNGPIKWLQDGTRGLVIDVPSKLTDESRTPCRFAYCFMIEAESA